MDYNTIGIDVSKNNLDLCILPSRTYKSTSNDIDGYKRLLEYIKQFKRVRVLVESTGCYHKNLETYLRQSGIEIYVLNPKQVRDYAKSCGKLAKTDRIDSYVIARYGETHELIEKSINSDTHETFRMLVERRRQMVNMRRQERSYLEKYKTLNNTNIISKIETAIMFYDNQILAIDKEIQELLSCFEALSDTYQNLTQVQGVGASTAYDLMSDMPELGHMSSREVAALAGVAPMNCDSGGMRGQRHIVGGRFIVRQALYMSCLSGIRYNPVIKAYYNRLKNELHKPFKVAMVACMRKMIIHLNKVCAK